MAILFGVILNSEFNALLTLDEVASTFFPSPMVTSHPSAVLETTKELPSFSVIVPTYNRLSQLTLCLQSLANLRYPTDRYEVIIVDDGGSVAIDPVVASFNERLDVTLIRQENAGPATARNTGAKHAKGDFLAFTDDDSAPAPDWLLMFAEQFAVTPNHLIGGRTLNALPKNLYSVASQQLIAYLYDYYNSKAKDQNATPAVFFTSNNLAIPTKSFHSVGGFDITFPLAAGEDRELCDRWLYFGHKMTYVPQAIMYHAHAMTLRSFWCQHFNYGRGAFYFHQKRGNRNQDRIKVEPLGFYLNLLSYPFSKSYSLRGIVLVLLLLCSQIANVLGYFWEKLGKRIFGKVLKLCR